MTSGHRTGSAAGDRPAALAAGTMEGGVYLPRPAGAARSAQSVTAAPAGVIPGIRADGASLALWMAAAAMLGRFVVRIRAGESDMLANGYSIYLELARNLIGGHGLCLAGGQACALRVPLYPLFVAPWLASDWLYPGLVIAQAAVGGALVWLAWRIGREVFDERTGLVGAALTALNPYALIHDTSVQDTVLVNALMALAAYSLWRAHRTSAARLYLAGGVSLGLAILTTARLTLVVPAVLAWAVVATGGAWRERLRRAACIGLPVALLVGGWTLRNWHAVGAPVLTTEAGESLWVANNQWAMAHFPKESIDLSLADSYAGMTPAEQAAFGRVSGSEVARDRLLRDWAVADIAAHPILTLANAARKVWVSASAELSPARGPWTQWGYRLLFLPIHLLAALAFWRFRAQWRTHLLFGALLASFVVTTGLFWAHTSHKSYLDAFLFVYAAAALCHPPARAAS